MNKKWNNTILNCDAHSSFEGVSSDHRIVTSKIRRSLRRNTPRTTTVHYDWSLLNKSDIRDKYALTHRKQFNELQEITETHTSNDEDENFVNAPIRNISRMHTN